MFTLLNCIVIELGDVSTSTLGMAGGDVEWGNGNRPRFGNG